MLLYLVLGPQSTLVDTHGSGDNSSSNQGFAVSNQVNSGRAVSPLARSRPVAPALFGNSVGLTNVISPGTPTSVVHNLSDPMDRLNKKAHAWVAQQNGKINFWGRILDQDEHPLSDVRVVMKVRRWRLAPAGADFPEFVTTTDADGRFQFLDASGDTMSINSLTKPGYRLSMEDQRRSMAYQYHNLSVTFIPDPSKPEIFHLYREKGAEPMILHDLRGRIPVDGTPIEFDLRPESRSLKAGIFRFLWSESLL